MTVKSTFATMVVLAVSLTACVVENDHDHYWDGTSEVPPAPVESAAPANVAPLLVEVDTDQVMTADPGGGVGVFVEYGAGGKWHIWWTCDTARTNQACDFVVDATAKTGTLSGVDVKQLTGGFVDTPASNHVQARITTTRQVHGIAFVTDPGAIVTVEASVGGLKDGSFLFFVQDGKVNGGYTGRLTNPLDVQGKTP